LILREAKESDIDSLLPMIQLFCAEIGCPYDEESVKGTLLNCLRNEWLLSVVYEGESPIGMCMAFYVPNIADFGRMQVSEAAWHSAPFLPPYKRAKAMMLMLAAMEKYAERMKARLVVSTSVGKSGSLDDHLEYKGYTLREQVYSKEFGHGY